MSGIFQILQGTPFYVWIILGFILFVGLKSTKTQTVPLIVFFFPVLGLCASKYAAFFSLTFILSMILGVGAGFLVYRKEKIQFTQNSFFVQIPGSYIPLFLLIFFFTIRYIFGYLKTAAPGIYADYVIIENILSGLFAGFFLGRALCYSYRYLKRVQ